ncbi:MAG: hypothetical protein CMJ64_15060 [Planctomycetaceae bacterium]|nr:hypothetical protein [Planctomycetaceae bacterium]
MAITVVIAPMSAGTMVDVDTGATTTTTTQPTTTFILATITATETISTTPLVTTIYIGADTTTTIVAATTTTIVAATTTTIVAATVITVTGNESARPSFKSNAFGLGLDPAKIHVGCQVENAAVVAPADIGNPLTGDDTAKQLALRREN